MFINRCFGLGLILSMALPAMGGVPVIYVAEGDSLQAAIDEVSDVYAGGPATISVAPGTYSEEISLIVALEDIHDLDIVAEDLDDRPVFTCGWSIETHLLSSDDIGDVNVSISGIILDGQDSPCDGAYVCVPSAGVGLCIRGIHKSIDLDWDNPHLAFYDCDFIHWQTGVYCWEYTFPLFDGCNILDNGVIDTQDYKVGGMYLQNKGAPYVRNCLFQGNRGYQGAGVYIKETYLERNYFESCRFEDNEATQGGAAYLDLARTSFLGCEFIENVAIAEGGAIWAVGVDEGGEPNENSFMEISQGCLFQGNESGQSGAALWIDGLDYGCLSPLLIDQCDFQDNISTGLSGDAGGAISLETARGKMHITNCTFTSNQIGNNSIGGGIGIRKVNGGTSDREFLVQDCVFANNFAGFGGGGIGINQFGFYSMDWIDIKNSNFCGNRLGMLSKDGEDVIAIWSEKGIEPPTVSHCTVDPEEKEDPETRFVGVNLEFLEVVSCAACPADFNGDGVVNGEDFGLLLAAWGTTDPTYDLDGNGDVGGSDIGLFLVAWGPCP